MLCYRFLHKVAPAYSAKVSRTKWPLLHHVVQMGHTDRSHPNSTEHDTQHIAYLISKQAVPYRTRGGTYCPGGLLLRFGS
jgi:hypothetical protein